MRQIVLDTETTGLEPEQGHRIIEIGCVEHVCGIQHGKSFAREPSIQHLDDAGAQRLGLHDAAVEEYVRGAREAARPAANA